MITCKFNRFCNQIINSHVKQCFLANQRLISQHENNLEKTTKTSTTIKNAEDKIIHDFSTSLILQGFADKVGGTIPTEATPSSLINGVRFDELPIAHIKSSPNNTIISITDYTGLKLLGRSSCGQEGFKNVKKSTAVAAQAAGLSAGLKVMKKGIKFLRVAVKGIGVGRLPCMKGLQMAGLNIVSLTDRTPLIHSGPRPRKAKRL